MIIYVILKYLYCLVQHRFECQAAATQTKAAFFDMAGVPNVIGCVDCTNVRIMGPSDNEHEYINR